MLHFVLNLIKNGVGTGAGEAYDVNLSSLNNPILWRMLYKGYCGSTYQSWGLECDDDLYYATKTAVHCFAYGVSPTEKYEVVHRVGWGQDITLEDAQRRSAKVLQVSQAIYEYGFNSNDNYIKATVTVSAGSQAETTIGGTKYLVQNYTATANKELSSYKVSILGFPNGTKILNASNADATTMTNSNFKIAIPVSNITQNFKGYINITEARVKTFPIFYADSGSDSKQDYVISDPSEATTVRTTLDVDAYKSTLKIIKKDADNTQPVAGAVFNVKYADGTNIGNYTTDSSGTITVNKLKQSTVVVTEISAPSKYIVDSAPKNVVLQYNTTSTLNVTNARKKGNIKVIKYDKDNHQIRLNGVEFKLYNSSQALVGTYTTDSKGEIYINSIDIGNYTLKETKTRSIL